MAFFYWFITFWLGIHLCRCIVGFDPDDIYDDDDEPDFDFSCDADWPDGN